MKRIFLLLCIAFFITAMACNKQESKNSNSNSDNSTENPTNENQCSMKITIGNTAFKATLADNETAKAFKAKLPLTLQMNDYGGFEKIANIGNLPTNDKHEASLISGDLMLYNGNTLVLFYDNHGGYYYTRIGKIQEANGLQSALGRGTATVKFELE